MSNEQRAHDLAIAITNFYLNNPDKARDQFPFIQPRKDNLVYDPYCIYKYVNNEITRYLNEDFK